MPRCRWHFLFNLHASEEGLVAPGKRGARYGCVMVVFRCTRKLLRHLENEGVREPTTSTTRLGDWFANLVPRIH
jgi:hypothetical protein